MSEPNTALHYVNGEWVDGPDPVMDAWAQLPEGEGIREADLMSRLGYYEINVVGRRVRDGFTIWQREQHPRFALAFGDGELTEYLYIHRRPDLQDVCGRWVALNRDYELTELLIGLQRDEKYIRGGDEDDVLVTIARRLAEGAGQRYRR